MLAAAVQLTAWLRQVMLVAALVVGSVTGLVLAHCDDSHHAVEAAAPSALAHAHADAASAAWWLGEAAAGEEPAGSGPFGDALAFCLTLAGCFAVILLVLFGLRRLPVQWRLLTRSVADPPMWAGRRTNLLPLWQQSLLCVYRI